MESENRAHLRVSSALLEQQFGMFKHRAPWEKNKVSTAITKMTKRRYTIRSLQATTNMRTGHHTWELASYGLPLTIINTYIYPVCTHSLLLHDCTCHCSHVTKCRQVNVWQLVTTLLLRSTSELTAMRQAPFSFAALGLSVWLSKLLHLWHLWVRKRCVLQRITI